jgi:hypothetical protein
MVPHDLICVRALSLLPQDSKASLLGGGC